MNTGTVTITASQSGNEYYLAAADVSQSLTITDTQSPIITAPTAITQSNTTEICGAVITYTAPIGTDNFPGATTVQTAGLASGAEFPVGTTTNIFQVTDASGNTASCSFTVTITDNELPTLNCPGNIIKKKDGNFHGAIVTYPTPEGTDNCSGIVITQKAGLPSGSIFPIGTTTNTYEVADASGNTTSCSFTITVLNSISPNDIEENTGLIVKAYPNPAIDFVNITTKTETPRNMSLRLYDIFGVLVGTPLEIIGSTNESTTQINVSQLIRGVYIYTLSADGNVLFTDKIVKQ